MISGLGILNFEFFELKFDEFKFDNSKLFDFQICI